MFDGRRGEFLQPGDHRERNGHPAALAGLEQEQGLARRRLLCGLGRVFRQRAVPHFGDDVGALGQAQHVQDQGHPAVAHDGGAGEGGESLELLAQRLDDDFLGVVDLVHHQAEGLAVGLEHDDVDRRRTVVGSPAFRGDVASVRGSGRPAAAGWPRRR